MTLHEALKSLEKAGTAQNRRVSGRHGVTGPMFGVSGADFGKLKKQLKTDHALAKQLWASGYHDARILATMIADPRMMHAADLESWAKNLDNYVLTDAFAGVAVQSPQARRMAEKWIDSPVEWLSAAGWNILARLAAQPGALDEDQASLLIGRIEKQIHLTANRTRYAMNIALIALGMRGGSMTKQAIAAARRIGPVEVDHGQTGCKTPDAATYIAKAAAHVAARNTRAAARKTTAAKKPASRGTRRAASRA